jgi:arsenate reductase
MGKIKIYGIPNCDITKKAIAWLNKNKISFTFHDYKQEGISKEKLQEWLSKEKLDTIFNKRSTTWRELPAAEQDKANNAAGAIRIMMAHNSIIKRPVIEVGNKLIIGFNEEQYNKQLKQ